MWFKQQLKTHSSASGPVKWTHLKIWHQEKQNEANRQKWEDSYEILFYVYFMFILRLFYVYFIFISYLLHVYFIFISCLWNEHQTNIKWMSNSSKLVS